MLYNNIHICYDYNHHRYNHGVVSVYLYYCCNHHRHNLLTSCFNQFQKTILFSSRMSSLVFLLSFIGSQKYTQIIWQHYLKRPSRSYYKISYGKENLITLTNDFFKHPFQSWTDTQSYPSQNHHHHRNHHHRCYERLTQLLQSCRHQAQRTFEHGRAWIMN